MIQEIYIYLLTFSASKRLVLHNNYYMIVCEVAPSIKSIPLPPEHSQIAQIQPLETQQKQRNISAQIWITLACDQPEPSEGVLLPIFKGAQYCSPSGHFIQNTLVCEFKMLLPIKRVGRIVVILSSPCITTVCSTECLVWGRRWS